MARALIHVPDKARPGEVVEIKTLISHPMESGFRVGTNGQLIPRDIITRFTCTYAGTEVFSAEFSPAIAANPFISFFMVAASTGDLVFEWTGDNGFHQIEKAVLNVA